MGTARLLCLCWGWTCTPFLECLLGVASGQEFTQELPL